MKHFLKLYIICVILSLSWLWGDCEEGEVELWGECYNIEETTDLNLSGSGLTGEIPPEIGNLMNLTSLKLYTNQLTGSIPSEIGTLTNLNRLYLYNNQLTGGIPSSIGNLNNLEFLLLNNNQLSGLIPGNLCDIIYVNVGGNNLCPPYPECLSEDVVGYQDTTNCSQDNITVDYQSNWNLVGLPLEVDNNLYNNLFSDAVEGTLYSFSGGYNLETHLIQGKGYWLRFVEAGSTNISGTPINELTISLNLGWNLISGISTLINIFDIQDPDGIIIFGTIYGFISGGYSNTENIEPGKGYWVRANSSGYIFLISIPELLPEECYLEPDVGPCDGVCPRYFYNQETEQCEEFSWGCCEGLVPFDTLEECINTCE